MGRVLTNFKSNDSYKKALEFVSEYYGADEINSIIDDFDNLFKKEWKESFKFNTDRILYTDEQKSLNGVIWGQIGKFTKHGIEMARVKAVIETERNI